MDEGEVVGPTVVAVLGVEGFRGRAESEQDCEQTEAVEIVLSFVIGV